MKVLSTKVHGVMDYLVGIILIAAPWLLNFYRGGAETWVPVTLGIAAVLYSLLTNYEYSISNLIPMRVHLAFDILSGCFLALSPWMFDFADYVYVPHVVLGIVEIGTALMTETEPRRTAYPTRSTH